MKAETTVATLPKARKQSKTGLVMIVMFLLGLAFVYLLERFVVKIDNISGVSMMPTLLNGETVLVDRVVYDLHGPRYGDVIAIPWGSNGVVKRVIGLSGDTIRISGGSVYRNGVALQEPYIAAPTQGAFGPLTVPAGMVFLLGDNRNESRDSRSFGSVPVAAIIGRVDVVVWPLKDTHWQPFGLMPRG